ncbi:PAAR domain-containing protein [Paraburkholderia sp. LEh10]|nr:PAAR domain-containing protein [Paraburkholderia sp. LEh10]
MINLIRLGDTTDHGGEVVTASDTMRYGRVGVARKGDAVACPQHPDINPNLIVEGDETICDAARRAAHYRLSLLHPDQRSPPDFRGRHRAACGHRQAARPDRRHAPGPFPFRRNGP